MRRSSRDLSDEAAATIGRETADEAAATIGRETADDSAATVGHETAENRARPSADPLRRLGVSEYVLFGLIALGIAITVVMALFNP